MIRTAVAIAISAASPVLAASDAEIAGALGLSDVAELSIFPAEMKAWEGCMIDELERLGGTAAKDAYIARGSRPPVAEAFASVEEVMAVEAHRAALSPPFQYRHHPFARSV